MNLKYATLVLLFVKSIMTARMEREEIVQALIAAKDKELENTFKKLEKQNGMNLSLSLYDMAKNEKHLPKAVRCLEMAKDPYPKEESNVGWLVHYTVYDISAATYDNTEAFANAVASFKPSAVKPLASIRYWVLWRNDAKDVLKQLMAKSPELIISSLARWLASHGFDRSSDGYKDYESARKQAFEYLASLATERVLSDALDIVKKNEHYKRDSTIFCCEHETYPSDLEALLKLVQGRKKKLYDILAFLPTVLVGLVDGYLTVDDLFAEISSAITK